MNRSQLLAIAAVTAIAGGAFLAGRSSVSRDSARDSGSTQTPGISSRTSSTGGAATEAHPGARHAEGAKGSLARPADKEARLTRLEEIIRNGDPIERNRQFLAYVDRLDPAEMQDAVERFRSLGLTETRFGEYSMLLTAWAKSDPVSALTYAKEKTGGNFATNTILSAWASNNPDAAIRWAEANADSDAPNHYLIGVIQGIAGTDVTRATQLLATMPYSNERGEALTALLPFVLAQGTGATRDWVASIQDERLREGVLGRVVEQLAQKEPKATADWLLTNPSPSSIRQLDDALATWMDTDKPAALSYYNALPSGEARTSALRGIVNTMATEDPQAAAKFMDSHPADTNDQVIQQFVWHSSQEDPALAASYIAKIADSGEQENLYNRMLTGWLRRDPDTAKQWIQSNPLPEAVNTRLQRAMQRIDQPR